MCELDFRTVYGGIKGDTRVCTLRGSQKVNLYDNVSSLFESLRWPSNSCIKCNLQKTWENWLAHLAVAGRAKVCSLPDG